MVKAAHEGLDARGFGLSSVRFICGTQDIHKQLEQKVSRFLGTDDTMPLAHEDGHDLVAINDALEALARVDERKSRVIELRFFGGLSVDETAIALKVSPDTVTRDWRIAKTWLLRELRRERPA